MKRKGADRAWPFAEGGGSTILVTTILLLAVVSWQIASPSLLSAVLLVVALTLWLLILYFFRDPNRQPVVEPGLVVGPGDGEIVEIVREREGRYLDDEVIRLSMFLSITNVHVQRVPIGGTVRLVDAQPGKFLQAFKPEASDVNEYVGMVIDTPFGPILVKQIAGILARRCVNYCSPGDEVETGNRFGLIRFSSRIDLYLPTDAQLLVGIGDKVQGGLTKIAQLARE